MNLLQKIILVILVALLGSCSNIVFDEAVPVDQKSLDQFPTELQGIYIDKARDTLSIFPDRYIYGEIKGNSQLEGQLGNDLVLKQFEDYYFLNFKNEDGFWEMIAAQKTASGLVLMCLDVEDKDEIKNINKHISKGHAKSLKQDGKYLIDPTTLELIKILNDTSICEESPLTKIIE